MIQREREGVRGDGDGRDSHASEGTWEGGAEVAGVGYAGDIRPQW